jgi:hypothetical protein
MALERAGRHLVEQSFLKRVSVKDTYFVQIAYRLLLGRWKEGRNGITDRGYLQMTD